MNTTVGIIVALLYIAFQIVAHVSQAAKKQRERMEREQQRRNAQVGLAGTQPQGAPPTVTPESLRQPPQAELAARRQAQLQQLRMRQEAQLRARTTAPQRPMSPPRLDAPPTARTRPDARPFQQQPQSPVRVPPRQSPPVLQPRRPEPVPVSMANLEQERRKQARDREAAARTVVEREDREAAQLATRTLEQRRSDAADAGTLAAGTSQLRLGAAAARVPLAGIVAAFKDPVQLRAAFVMREVLDRPLSLRD